MRRTGSSIRAMYDDGRETAIEVWMEDIPVARSSAPQSAADRTSELRTMDGEAVTGKGNGEFEVVSTGQRLTEL